MEWLKCILVYMFSFLPFIMCQEKLVVEELGNKLYLLHNFLKSFSVRKVLFLVDFNKL